MGGVIFRADSEGDMEELIAGIQARAQAWQEKADELASQDVEMVGTFNVALSRVADAFSNLAMILEGLRDSSGADVDYIRHTVSSNFKNFDKWIASASPAEPDHVRALFQTLVSLYVQALPVYTLHAKFDEDLILHDVAKLQDARRSLSTLESEVRRATARLKRVANTVDDSEQALTRIQEISKSAESINSELTSKQGEATAHSESISRAQATTTDAQEKAAALLKQSETLQQRLDSTLETAEGAEQEIQDFRDRIEALLPGATSAGLAESFHKRAVNLFKIQIFWGFAFVITVIGLAILSFALDFSSGEFIDIGAVRISTKRLFVVVPLVWIGWFCARQFGFTTRLQEQYRFKASVSAAFEGYKNQMKDVDPTVVKELSSKSIEVLGENPGDVFDKSNQAHPAEGWNVKGLGWFSRK